MNCVEAKLRDRLEEKKKKKKKASLYSGAIRDSLVITQ